MMIEEFSVEKLANLSDEERANWQFIDVREPQEVDLAQIEGFEVLSLSQFREWSEAIHARFDKDKPTVVMCHHGMRSQQMCQWLINQGFTDLKNLSGGIDAYSYLVDPSVPRY
ncbi:MULTISPECIES: rhodanese-like domain-containing protein [unclassified Roseofilum]|uniref:rhodanese-like domain-containing protein n=1 Tax=unclassified Roseofilum TaxID=2620099 RepID=UPI000E8DFC38|nr:MULTISPECIES: rhodanese-like domain-containing protein [unclassified Roseofilum]MBP0008557.1 rhodanese-related sulfurtransferase [Roseofilum sp. Belize Diploria]MBP0033778.1 rhodanese-related sulfurtransferase [Roseofilum sp. Belize BBD 4]HBQ98210.1 rhodanese-related sulfurtransferase [Cyanobacteria bacterium UBA11691]